MLLYFTACLSLVVLIAYCLCLVVLIAYLEAEAAVDKKGVVCYPGVERDLDVPCRVNTSALTEDCNIENNFGYGAEKQPCVLLRLNKVIWYPVLALYPLWTGVKNASV